MTSHIDDGWDSYRDMIVATPIRDFGPHRVTDTIRQGPHPFLPGGRTAPVHCVVVCQVCGAECPEAGEDALPEECIVDSLEVPPEDRGRVL